ncbi:ELAV-like protein 2 [Condylostylus longicornis]|uniref:ELAV-like protein 2 n=1 Tax=Condylostylus longicornis TaxID=2530218 RepID=UPI00244DF9A0|nr:ELAV-like protein 2 [Condylostylus longicornis]
MVRNSTGPVHIQASKIARFNPMAKSAAEHDREPSNSSERKKNSISELITEYSIYLFNLTNDVTENDLWRLFGPFGAIKNVTIVRDSKTNQSKGFGFVTMKNLEEATNAIDILNGFALKGRPIKVSFKGSRVRSDDEENVMGEPGAYQIYVFNLSSSTIEDSIWKLFAQFGAVKNVSIVCDPKTNKFKGFAFVTMKKFEEAEKAIKTLNGFKLDGRNLMVSFKGQRPDDPENGVKDYTSDRIQSIPIYINYLPENVEDGEVWKLFSQFGAIKDIRIIRDGHTKKCSGYGFVNMKNLDEATLAINTLNGFEMNGKHLQVNLKGKKYL